MSSFPAQMPSDFGLFTIDGNAAAAKLVARELQLIGEFLPGPDAMIAATSVTDRLGALGHSEAWDTAVFEMIHACLTGGTHSFLGLDPVAL